jgi:hypothetical protein
MSRGWESKSVEEQQAQAAAPTSVQTTQTNEPTSTNRTDSAVARAQEAERKRQLQDLELQRERILSERTSSPHRRTALTNALADIEEKLAQLGWTIHL